MRTMHMQHHDRYRYMMGRTLIQQEKKKSCVEGTVKNE